MIFSLKLPVHAQNPGQNPIIGNFIDLRKRSFSGNLLTHEAGFLGFNNLSALHAHAGATKRVYPLQAGTVRLG